MDANFVKISEIKSHENADSLEIAVVSNFPCVVKKGEFKAGDWVFYIRDDAKLIGWDEARSRQESVSEDGTTEGMYGVGEGQELSFPWQESLLGYLGGGGRVKTIRLRGKTSMGILLKTEVVCPRFLEYSGKQDVIDGAIKALNICISDKESGESFLERHFGVKHWTAPQTNIGDLSTLHCGLEDGVRKSDEENWENLEESDLHLGSKCLVTKKLDGTSCTVICRADGTYAIASRSNTLRPECDNVYTKYTKEAVKAGLWYAKKHGVTIAFQGEICCQSVQRFGVNKDKDLNDYFIYKCYFPNEETWHLRMGTYGTKAHFTEIVKICNEEGGFELKTVPIVGHEIVSRELLGKYNDMTADWGEGVVINVMVEDINDMSSLVWDYKSKSREYLMKIK